MDQYCQSWTSWQEKLEDWDEYLLAALFAWREVPHTFAGYSPATLLIGRPIKGHPGALMRMLTGNSPVEMIQTASNYVGELKQQLEVGWKLTASTLKKTSHKHSASIHLLRQFSYPHIEQG